MRTIVAREGVLRRFTVIVCLRSDFASGSSLLARAGTSSARANGAKSPSPGWTVCLRPSLGLWFGRRSRLWHQEPHNRDGKHAYRCHTHKCCRPIKVRGDEPKECSAERSTKS